MKLKNPIYWSQLTDDNLENQLGVATTSVKADIEKNIKCHINKITYFKSVPPRKYAEDTWTKVINTSMRIIPINIYSEANLFQLRILADGLVKNAKKQNK